MENSEDFRKQMENLEDLRKQEEAIIRQIERQKNENKRIKGFLLRELKQLIDNIPKYPFYNKYKAILAKTIIDIQYLT